jgi:GTP cyclohydrolase IIa
VVTVTETQVTLVQLDNYGPWTTTPSPRPEPDLQALQADIYADLARLYGAAEGYVFSARYDNVIAVTNGVEERTHRRVQETLSNQYPVTVSVAAAVGERPADALGAASRKLQAAGSAQAADRTEVLDVEAGGEAVEIAHFDVVDVTGQYTDTESAYRTFLRVQRVVLELSAHLHERHGALAFFVGGDNVIAVCPELPREAYEEAVERVGEATGVGLQVGVGSGTTAIDAGMDAKEALERCREHGTAVEGDLRAATDAD